MILYINACVREESRTRRLADRLLRRFDDDVLEVMLSCLDLPRADGDFIRERNALIEKGDYSSPLFDHAKNFAAADTIVIAAPFWDLSFPAALKQYLEQICVLGLTFYYENDMPKGLCRAGKLYYITTAGGPIYSSDYGYGYVKSLAETFFGIRESRFIKAEGLDIYGADAEGIIKKAENLIDEMPL